MPTIFVFGSNLAGRHGAGAARDARLFHGAIYGQGEGLQGDSYAIPTKGWRMETLSLRTIQGHVATFLAFDTSHPEMTFQLTPIGCGLAGYRPEQIAQMFNPCPANVIVPEKFKP
jgi:hypothetical protein